MNAYVYTAHELYFGGICLVSGFMVGAAWQLYREIVRRNR